MYKIERIDIGLWLTLGGIIYGDEMKSWLNDLSKELTRQKEGFHVFVDMRTLKPLPEESQHFINEGQKLAKRCGMIRSVVILNNPVTTMQFKRIAQETGIYEWERYINSSEDPNWEQTGMDWLKQALDPDRKKVVVP